MGKTIYLTDEELEWIYAKANDIASGDTDEDLAYDLRIHTLSMKCGKALPRK